MPKTIHLLAAAAVLFLTLGVSTAFAQVCVGTSFQSFGINTYHGYSNQPADLGAPGTSTVIDLTNHETKFCSDGTSGTRTKTVHNYVDGPGKSNFDRFDEEMCEETGTLLPCP